MNGLLIKWIYLRPAPKIAKKVEKKVKQKILPLLATREPRMLFEELFARKALEPECRYGISFSTCSTSIAFGIASPAGPWIMGNDAHSVN